MADPISVSSGVVALVTFAFQCSVGLYQTVRELQSQDKRARALKSELSELSTVLESLLETIDNNPELDFRALEQPLRRCANACDDYGKIIKRCFQYSTASHSSLRDWVTQKYLQGDITDFKDMLAGYKSTINIALVNANIRVAAITPAVLRDYQDMIRDTTADLQENLQRLEDRVQQLSAGQTEAVDVDEIEWQAILEEKESTQQGLRMCAQLSAQIELFEKTPKEHPQFSKFPSAHKHIMNGLGPVNNSLHTLINRLQIHGADLDARMNAMKSANPKSQSTITQIAQLQETRDSIRQCISVVSDASQDLVVERRNIFEDITMAGDTYDFSVSTVGDLVTARRINLKDRARHVGGQITDESYQKTIEAFKQLDMMPNTSRQPSRDSDQSGSGTGSGDTPASTKEFSNRHGPGFKLAEVKKY